MIKLKESRIMKTKEVLQLLRISRTTLTKYVKNGLIKVTTLPNGRYDYNEESVYKNFNKNLLRETCVYARVSTSRQKKFLENQIELLKQFCFFAGYTISDIHSDIASGISFEKRKNFFQILDKVIEGKIERTVITYKDRLSRVGFELFKHLFKKYHCEIVVISEQGSKKLDNDEIFEEIVSLLHCYSMKLYSKRKIKKIKKVVSEEKDYE